MSRPTKSEDQRPSGAFLLAPESGFRHYRLLVLAVATVLTVLVVLLDRWLGTSPHHLPPVESFVVLISALSAAVAGLAVGISAATVGVVTAFLLLADFTTARGAVNALVSGAIWMLAATATGLVARRLRIQVMRREKGLADSLSQSMAAKDALEHLLEVNPQLQQGRTLTEVATTACKTALATFGADGVRVFKLVGTKVELLAIWPPSETIDQGFTLSTSDFPDFELMLASRRPLFVRDVSETHPTGSAARLRDELAIVSTVRLPIVGPSGPSGMLSLSWTHPIDKPDDSQLAVMQRFSDQTAIAWHNALRVEAQQRAAALHKTLERLVRLAPSFHITGSRQVVARAICEAALATFQCSGAALYQVEGDRLRLSERVPHVKQLPAGRTFPLTGDMRLSKYMRSAKPTFLKDASRLGRSTGPWPSEIVQQIGTKSALYVPLRMDERGPSDLLVLTWTRSRHSPDDSFIVLAQRFADQASLALAHSSAESLHARLEASLLPTTPIDHPLVDVLTRYRTGEQRLRLGGDFLGSTISKEDVLSFVIGDVSGHGPDAAALGATLRSTWKALTLSGQSLTKITQVMTDIILAERNAPEAFATVIIGKIDLGKGLLTWINAGHMPPLLVADEVSPLQTPPTPPLGIGGVLDRRPHQHRLPKHWSLFLYTDGLIDTRLTPGSRERYGEDRLKERLEVLAHDRLDGAAIDTLLAEVEASSGSHFADDVAILMISTKEEEATAT